MNEEFVILGVEKVRWDQKDMGLVCSAQKPALHLAAGVGMLRGSEQDPATGYFTFYCVKVAA